MKSRVREVLGHGRIRLKCRMDLRMKGFKGHDCSSSEYQGIECGCLEGGCKPLVSEHRSEIVRINSYIISFPLFRIDVPSSS